VFAWRVPGSRAKALVAMFLTSRGTLLELQGRIFDGNYYFYDGNGKETPRIDYMMASLGFNMGVVSES